MMSRFCSRQCFAPVLIALGILGLANRASAQQPVPFQGAAAGMVIAAEPAPPDGRLLTATAAGQATHLGQFRRDERVVLRADFSISGTLVFTAANGDRLFATVSGGFNSPTTAVGTYVFTGGTGRFQNASGSARFALVTPDGIRFAVTFDGTITY
jgi:hypothetical protein